jgi:phosphorylcholine metabolism protein LicD
LIENLDKLKTRVRSQEELNFRKKGLLEFKQIFEKNKIPFFIWGGLLLGVRRDNNFIKWDWDVELGLFEKDIKFNWENIIKLLETNNFQIIEKNFFNLKIDFIKYGDKDSTIYSLVGWRYDFFTGNYLRKKLSVPKKFFSKLYEIKFFDEEFLCPGPVEDFLQFFYGDWKNPKKTSDKKDYLSREINKKNLWKIYTLIDKIKYRIFNVQK